MIRIIRSDEHHIAEHGWLETYHHFSFGDYQNEEKMGFGPLRVFNDDTIQPGTGFGFHPHDNMEIITYVIDGELEHRDNFGNRGIIGPGEVQRMSAGTGIIHSEYNHSGERPLRLLQMWVYPDTRGLRPSWEQQIFTKEQQKDRLLPVVVPESAENEGALRIHQDATFYLSTISPHVTVRHEFKGSRIAYVFVIKGGAEINGKKARTRDAVMLEGEGSVSITAQERTEIMLVEMPERFTRV